MTSGSPDDDPITTHEAARMLRVTPMTIIQWFEDGALHGWKTAGGHRRIPRAEVEALARGRGIPLASEAKAPPPPKDDAARLLARWLGRSLAEPGTDDDLAAETMAWLRAAGVEVEQAVAARATDDAEAA